MGGGVGLTRLACLGTLVYLARILTPRCAIFVPRRVCLRDFLQYGFSFRFIVSVSNPIQLPLTPAEYIKIFIKRLLSLTFVNGIAVHVHQ